MCIIHITEDCSQYIITHFLWYYKTVAPLLHSKVFGTNLKVLFTEKWKLANDFDFTVFIKFFQYRAYGLKWFEF